jgi:hypothetical protein
MIGIGTPRIQSRIPREKFIAILLVLRKQRSVHGTLSNKNS